MYISSKILSRLATLLLSTLLFALSSCYPSDECIDPDDWGGVQKTTVSSYGSSAAAVHDDGAGAQTIDWQTSHQLDGKRVVMMIKNVKPQYARSHNCQSNEIFTPENSWMPIWGKYFKPDVGRDSYTTLSMCEFQDYTSANGYPWCPTYPPGASDMTWSDLPVINLPCKLYRGLGLYSVVAQAQNRPTHEEFQSEFGKQYLFHIGDSAHTINKYGANINKGSDSVFFSQGCPTGGASFAPPSECIGNNKCALYFKIMDRFYGTGSDNYGSYTIEFKQGVQTSNVRLITRFVGIVNALMCDVSKTMYTKLVQGRSFVGYVRVMLILTIVFLGASVLTGFSGLTYKEMLILVLKIGIVLQLISPTSWDFFNNTLFKFFTNGIGEVTGIIFGAGNLSAVKVDLPAGITASGDCEFQTLAGFSVFDDVLAQLFSRETTLKVLSFFTYKGAGFLFVPIIYTCIVVVLFILLKSLLVYLVSILVISVIIAIAPLFISFILFEKTKYIFDSWLRALISYFIQPIIIMTFAFFVLQIFLAQLHSLVGIRVCWKEWANLYFFKIYAWQADYQSDAKPLCMLTPGPIMKYCDSSSQTCKGGATGADAQPQDKPKDGQKINMVGNLTMAKYPFTGSGSCTADTTNIIAPRDELACTPYTCAQERYIDFPYLDPSFPPDQDKVAEMRRGKLISIKDMVILVLLIWFMYEFNKLVPNIAKQLSGGSGGVNLNATAGALGGAMFKYMAKKPAGLVGSGLGFVAKKTGLTDKVRALRFGIVRMKEALQDKVGGLIDNRVARLKKNVGEKIDNFSKANPNAARALKVGGAVLKGTGHVLNAVLRPHAAVGSLLSVAGTKARGELGAAKEKIEEKVINPTKAIVGSVAGQVNEAAIQKAQDLSNRAKAAVSSVTEPIKEAVAKTVEDQTNKVKTAIGDTARQVKESIARKLGLAQAPAAQPATQGEEIARRAEVASPQVPPAADVGAAPPVPQAEGATPGAGATPPTDAPAPAAAVPADTPAAQQAADSDRIQQHIQQKAEADAHAAILQQVQERKEGDGQGPADGSDRIKRDGQT